MSAPKVTQFHLIENVVSNWLQNPNIAEPLADEVPVQTAVMMCDPSADQDLLKAVVSANAMVALQRILPGNGYEKEYCSGDVTLDLYAGSGEMKGCVLATVSSKVKCSAR